MNMRMLEMNLADHGMGIEKVSEVDFLVFMDDQILVDHDAEKGNRADRRRKTKMTKKHLNELSKYAMVEIRKNGKIVDNGYKTYFKGKKAWSRKDRYARFEEVEVPIYEDEDILESIPNDDIPWMYRYTPLAEQIDVSHFWFFVDFRTKKYEEYFAMEAEVAKIEKAAIEARKNLAIFMEENCIEL